LSFEAAPCAVCFAVDLTALRASFLLIGAMAIRYPVAGAQIGPAAQGAASWRDQLAPATAWWSSSLLIFERPSIFSFLASL
jgi:hypothetical protein